MVIIMTLGNYNLDLDALYTFLIAVEQGSFSGAAQILYKTPSAVSYRIKTLEENLGVKLIDRTTRSIQPTEAGERLLHKIKLILALHQDLKKELWKIESGIEPCFTLVFNNLLYHPKAAAKLLAHLHQNFPDTNFRFERAVYMGVWDLLLYGSCHAAIGAPGFHSLSEEFESIALGEIEWVMICSADHPILCKAKNLDQKDLIKTPVVNIEDTSTTIQKRKPWRLCGQEEIIVPDLTTKIQCHIQGLGIGFLPKPLAEEYIHSGKLAKLEINGLYKEASPMSFVKPKDGKGKISSYIEALVKENSPLIQPFLYPISKSVS